MLQSPVERRRRYEVLNALYEILKMLGYVVQSIDIATSLKFFFFQARKSHQPEKQPAGSGPYAKVAGIISLRFPPEAEGFMVQLRTAF
jgi:hypothetical protein